MAARAGIPSWETDIRGPHEVWVSINAFFENMQLQWETTRAIVYNVAKWSGNMKNPNTRIEKFWPFSWDPKQSKADPRAILEQHAKMVALRKLLDEKTKKAV